MRNTACSYQQYPSVQVIWTSESQSAVVARECDCNATVVGSIPTWGNGLLFIIFSFLRSDTKSKVRRWVPQHDAQCLEKFGEKCRTEYLNTMFSLPTLLCAVYFILENNLIFKTQYQIFYWQIFLQVYIALM